MFGKTLSKYNPIIVKIIKSIIEKINESIIVYLYANV